MVACLANMRGDPDSNTGGVGIFQGENEHLNPNKVDDQLNTHLFFLIQLSKQKVEQQQLRKHNFM